MTVDLVKKRLDRPDLIGPVAGGLVGSAKLYLDMQDGVIRGWLVKDNAGRLMWACPSCLVVHWYYPNALYDPQVMGKGGDCCERGMRRLFQTNPLWKP